jgi:hypothetical protein
MAERFSKNGVSGWFDITDNMLRCLAVQSFADAVKRQNVLRWCLFQNNG